MEITFNDIDALVLSVIYQNNQLDLVKWIGMIDFYERIILTFEELNTSLEKLQKCGVIKFSNGEFILLTEIEKLFPKSFNIRNYEKICDKLAKKKYIEVMDSRFILSEAEYTEALNKYRKAAKSNHIASFTRMALRSVRLRVLLTPIIILHTLQKQHEFL